MSRATTGAAATGALRVRAGRWSAPRPPRRTKFTTRGSCGLSATHTHRLQLCTLKKMTSPDEKRPRGDAEASGRRVSCHCFIVFLRHPFSSFSLMSLSHVSRIIPATIWITFLNLTRNFTYTALAVYEKKKKKKTSRRYCVTARRSTHRVGRDVHTFQARHTISHSYEEATTPRCPPTYRTFGKANVHVRTFKYCSQRTRREIDREITDLDEGRESKVYVCAWMR